MPKKILYLFDASDWESRMAVAYAARDQGHEVIIGLLHGDEKAQERTSDFKIISIQKMLKIFALIKQYQPDIMHVVTLKYSFMAGIVALPFLRMKKIYTLAGLGYVFRGEGIKSKLLRYALRPFLTFILRFKNPTLIFQNADDLDLMLRQSYASVEHSVLIKGSGVYLDRFEINPSLQPDVASVLMPTRLVHEKGVWVFVEAARILKQRGVKAVFQIAGGETKHNPKAISKEQMLEMIEDGAAEWLGRVNDLPKRLADASLIVYPSYYGEGIPRVLLEACAAGRAIVTTDHPGCREAVADGKNGLLVPVKNPQATADAIEYLLMENEVRANMERESRIKAENEFDIQKIVIQTIALYNKI